MKRSKFSDPQVAFVLRLVQEGTLGGGLSENENLAVNLLQMAQEVQRPNAVGDETVEAAKGCEPAAFQSGWWRSPLIGGCSGA